MAATKDQERKALEQIRKIVEGLGEDSYIGMAFDGCFELAEENINNDWGCSMAEQVESYKEKEKELLADRDALKETVEDQKEIIRNYEERIHTLSQNSKMHSDEAIKNWNAFREMEDKNEELEQEIIKLKAKLYDMMVGA